MRVLIASDSFGGTLTAQEVCKAIAVGWKLGAPHDDLTLLPLSDGGPGFLAAIAASGREHVAKIRNFKVRGPLGADVEAQLCQLNETVYLESAQACGLNLVAESGPRGVREGSSFGVGQLLAEALKCDGIKRIVIGLGGSGTNDGGAGLLAALGCDPASELTGGGIALAQLPRIDFAAVRDRFAAIELIIATDVDNPLLGPSGASEVYAPQKGAKVLDVAELEVALTHFAAMTDPMVAKVAGAGAAGGLGFGLMLLGAKRISGIEMIADALDLPGAIAASDLVITGEGSFDWQSMRGKVIAGVAHFAAKYGRPVVVIAGQVHCARREFMSLGVESAYAVAETSAQIAASIADPTGALIGRAESVARTWSPEPQND